MTEYAVLQFFGHEGYPPEFLEVFLPVSHLANAMAAELPVCEETQEGLRKLLEARDCFQRAVLIKIAQSLEAEPEQDG